MTGQLPKVEFSIVKSADKVGGGGLVGKLIARNGGDSARGKRDESERARAPENVPGQNSPKPGYTGKHTQM